MQWRDFGFSAVSWYTPMIAGAAAVGAAFLGADRAGFSKSGIKKGSLASDMMSYADKTEQGKDAVSALQSVGTKGLSLKSAVDIASAAYNAAKFVKSATGDRE